jgi:uncharacterized protein YdhG (YjbR/CyaY superfamily)
MAVRPGSIDEYLSSLRRDQRAALEKLRRTIRAAAPRAEECISYGLPAFRHDGMLVAFGATANHCAFYPMSSSTVKDHREELEGYDTSKGTIRFPAERPLPAALVRTLVKARIAENAARRGSKKGGRVAARKPAASRGPGGARRDPAVTAYLRELDHPLKREIEAVRKTILGVSRAIGEGIKWNAPSFRTTDYFATVNVRSRDAVQLIFHRGAKVKDNTTKMEIADPAGLIRWLATDRCLVTLGAGRDVQGRQKALAAIVRAWVRQL